MKQALLILSFSLVSGSLMAQRDTSKPRQITVTSTFKPTLKEAAKINFNASPVITDTARPRLQYNLPNQNLSFAFQPGTLRPLALAADTGNKWQNESFVKLGYGNLRNPFLHGALSVGDGQTAGLTAQVKHISAEGKRAFQDFSNTSADVNAYFKNQKGLEWNARVGALQEKYNKYGFQPETLVFKEDSLAVKFQTWRGRLSFRNMDRGEFGLSYAPEVKIEVFNDGLNNSESNTYLNLPLQKSLGKTFAVDVAVTANLSRYKPEKRKDVVNNYLMLSPSLLYKSPNIKLQAGIRPSWDRKEFKAFPNVMGEFSTSDQKFSVQLGWVGYLRNSGFQYMAGINPWIWAPDSVYNTRVEERYIGLKGAAGNHFTFSVKAGFHKLNNQPLFTNDTLAASGGKSFVVLNEKQMKVIHLGGEVGYTVGEKFSLVSSLVLNQYTNLKTYDKPWGLLPWEFRTSMRIQVLRDLYVNSDLYGFDGPWYQTKSGRGNLGSALDFNAGVEFKIVKNIKLWAQFNNIFGKEYQRWNQYPVYGFNFLGGAVVSFGQKQ
jgi:hypothetical protein